MTNSNNKNKVLFITNIYPSQHEPNRGVFIQNQAKVLQNNGVEVAVLLLDYRSFRNNKKIGFRIEENEGIIQYIYSFPISPLHKLQYWLADVVTDCAYKKVEKEFGRPDIIHGHFLEGSYGLKGLKRKYHIPCVVTEHGSNVYLFNRTKFDTLHMNRLYRKMDKVIFVGNAQQENANDLKLQNSTVVHNVIPPYFKYENIIKEDNYIFITVANLIPSKRIDHLIKAFALVQKEFKNSKLIIVGKGAMYTELKNMTIKLKIADKVEFKGIVKNSDLVNLYNSSDCFVLPSVFETFGMVYAEALCCGLPIISVQNGGINEITEDCDYARVIAPDDYNVLADTMKKMIYADFDKISISFKYRDKFSEDKLYTKLIDIYTEAIEANSN